jgi:Ca-activated chloride channel family protein
VQHRLLAILSLILLLGLAACTSQGERTLTIVSGSENKSLEPLLKQFERQQRVRLEVKYLGSVDIMRDLQRGVQCPYDAAWPASTLWIALGDTQRVTKHNQSIMRSPVVFAVKKSVAARLGWLGKDITVRDILAAAEAGSVRFAMTSATQSNSGASAYLGYLHAFAGSPEVLTLAHLQAPQVQEQIRRFLGTVHRQTGSSGWLVDLLSEHYERFDAMVNYEALAIEANQKLVAQGREPLLVFYPTDGLTIADSPLVYIDHQKPQQEKLFLQLQTYLLSDAVQREILKSGRRVGRVGMTLEAVDRRVFNPDWGIDVQRLLSPIPMPSGEVIREALTLFQTAFRKPSLTAYVLDFSGSMRGTGEQQVKEAMRTLLDPDIASRYLLQPSARDVSIVIFFDSEPSAPLRVQGNDPRELRRLLAEIERKGAGGGTNMYKATVAALKLFETYEHELGQYQTAVIVMSDGKSEGSLRDVQRHRLSRDVPVYTIPFGEADPQQMRELAGFTSGRMFDGKADMLQAFREAKGYN